MRRDVSLAVQPEEGADYVPVFRLTHEPEEGQAGVVFRGQWISKRAARLIWDLGQVKALRQWRLASGAGADDFSAFMLKVDVNTVTLSKQDMRRAVGLGG